MSQIVKEKTSENSNLNALLDFKIKDYIYFGIVICGTFLFYKQTNAMMAQLIRTNEYLVGFATNSDLWHTNATGAVFVQGKPIEPLDLRKSRSIYEPENFKRVRDANADEKE